MQRTPTLIFGAIATVALASAQQPIFEEALLHVIPEDVSLRSAPRVGPDGKEYSDTARLVFSRDGRRVAYAAYKSGGRHAFVSDDPESGREGFHYMSSPVFSADSAHVAFRVGNRKSRKTEEWWALRDGKKSKKYDWIGELSLGPDGTLAFWEQPKAKILADGSYNIGQQVLYVGKKKGKKWQNAHSLLAPLWSDDGSRVVTITSKGGQWFVLGADTKNGKQRTLHKRGDMLIEQLAISADGRNVARVVQDMSALDAPGAGGPPGMRANLEILVGDKRIGGQYESAGSPVFAPNGKRVAFKFVDENKMNVAVDTDKKVSAKHDYVSAAVFSPDGSKLAYAAFDGYEIQPFYRMQSWGHLMLRGEGKAKLVVRKTKRGKPQLGDSYDSIESVVFGPKGERIAFAAKIGDRWCIIEGDRKSEEFDEVGPPSFDPDSSRIGFGARNGRKVYWKVLE